MIIRASEGLSVDEKIAQTLAFMEGCRQDSLRQFKTAVLTAPKVDDIEWLDDELQIEQTEWALFLDKFIPILRRLFDGNPSAFSELEAWQRPAESIIGGPAWRKLGASS